MLMSYPLITVLVVGVGEGVGLADGLGLTTGVGLGDGLIDAVGEGIGEGVSPTAVAEIGKKDVRKSEATTETIFQLKRFCLLMFQSLTFLHRIEH